MNYIVDYCRVCPYTGHSKLNLIQQKKKKTKKGSFSAVTYNSYSPCQERLITPFWLHSLVVFSPKLRESCNASKNIIAEKPCVCNKDEAQTETQKCYDKMLNTDMYSAPTSPIPLLVKQQTLPFLFHVSAPVYSMRS